jgi:glycosyltransferase involved in cell wall biosynthesis
VTAGIHQVLVAASPGDAITNMAFELRDALRRVGPSEIYARYIDPRLFDEVEPLDRYDVQGRNLVVFHASMGEPEVFKLLRAQREPIVLVYHNVTPAAYCEPYDSAFAELLDLGRRELQRLRPRVAATLAASAFNARELEGLGYRNVRVLPPLVDPYRLTRIPSHDLTENHLRVTFGDSPIVLSVGQLMPHKRADFLIEVMHLSATYLWSSASLLLVGAHRLDGYADAIRQQLAELHLPRVHLVGSVRDDELAAMYRAAAVVVTASEHEGFCLPLLEGMAFEKPVVARRCAAIPETVDDAALLLPGSAGPALFAEAINEVLENAATRDALVARGRKRLASFDPADHQRVFLHTLLEVA